LYTLYPEDGTETSVTNQPMPCNNPRSQLLRGGSLKSHCKDDCLQGNEHKHKDAMRDGVTLFRINQESLIMIVTYFVDGSRSRHAKAS